MFFRPQHVHTAEGWLLQRVLFKEYVQPFSEQSENKLAILYDTSFQGSGCVVEPLAADDLVNAFVVDESLLECTICRKTELGLSR